VLWLAVCSLFSIRLLGWGRASVLLWGARLFGAAVLGVGCSFVWLFVVWVGVLVCLVSVWINARPQHMDMCDEGVMLAPPACVRNCHFPLLHLTFFWGMKCVSFDNLNYIVV
jgi:hypothetical protein